MQITCIYFCVSMCVCVCSWKPVCVYMCVPGGYGMPWSWSSRQWWATRHRCWNRTLAEQPILRNAEASLQPLHLFCILWNVMIYQLLFILSCYPAVFTLTVFSRFLATLEWNFIWLRRSGYKHTLEFCCVYEPMTAIPRKAWAAVWFHFMKVTPELLLF